MDSAGCDRRDPQQPDRRGGVDLAQAARHLRRCAPGGGHRRRTHRGGAAVRGNHRGADVACGSAAGGRTHSGAWRFRRCDGQRRDHHARPRRLGLSRRRSSAPVSAPAKFRSGPTWTACSPPIPASSRTRRSCRTCRSLKRPSWRTSVRRCCTRRPSSRRSSRNIPGAHPELASRPGARHADHRRAAEERTAVDRGGVEEGGDGRRTSPRRGC